ncbi:MAG: cytochrome C oxidase Cbb3, partial [Thermoplasmata archaeon]|nr:cytochrome C oxidase Cbb3 [Thermoplasmata archaeon]NIU47944.1 cytochrome C oxidase Cbb3 [Thermoplasmata archaeon]NIW81425.1 cytochrome C oxidase Cbb3 [Thermoplasmata archaeon]NIY02883.1 cytochrome C oxidase Cbb3 [Thermoplasmata archaeon]
LGYNQGLEMAEMVTPIDVLVVVALLLVAVNAFGTVFRREEPQLYVSLWYIMGGLIWATLNYLVGNFVGYYTAQGVNSANVHAFYIHNFVGIFITPL